MKESSIDKIFHKIQYLSILNALYKYPEGLSLHELTYLLSTKKNMQKMSELYNRFNPYYPHEVEEKRKEIFRGKEPRSRIHTCLTELYRDFGLVEKIEKKYRLSKLSSEMFSLVLNINYFNFLMNQSKISKFYFEKWIEQQPQIDNLNFNINTNFISFLLTPDIQIYRDSSFNYKDEKKLEKIFISLSDNLKELKKIAGKYKNITVVMNTNSDRIKNLLIPYIYHV